MNDRKAWTALTCLLGAAVLALIPSVCIAGLLQNGDFDVLGPNGSPVTTTGQGSAGSAAAFWGQFAVVPNSRFTTELLPSTDPLPGGGGNMIHVTTNAGYFPPAFFGNGFGQGLQGGPLPMGAEASFDLLVLSGEVTAGLVLDTGPFANAPTFGQTVGWIHVTTGVNAPVISLAFETLTTGAGAEYFVDNARVTPVPEPSTVACS